MNPEGQDRKPSQTDPCSSLGAEHSTCGTRDQATWVWVWKSNLGPWDLTHLWRARSSSGPVSAAQTQHRVPTGVPGSYHSSCLLTESSLRPVKLVLTFQPCHFRLWDIGQSMSRHSDCVPSVVKEVSHTSLTQASMKWPWPDLTHRVLSAWSERPITGRNTPTDPSPALKWTGLCLGGPF